MGREEKARNDIFFTLGLGHERKFFHYTGLEAFVRDVVTLTVDVPFVRFVFAEVKQALYDALFTVLKRYFGERRTVNRVGQAFHLDVAVDALCESGMILQIPFFQPDGSRG